MDVLVATHPQTVSSRSIIRPTHKLANWSEDASSGMGTLLRPNDSVTEQVSSPAAASLTSQRGDN